MSAIGLPIGYNLSSSEENDYRVYQLIGMIVEECKSKWHMDARTVYQKLKTSGAVDYLTNGYDCLHTQSLEYVVDDVEEMVKEFEEAGNTNGY